MDHSVLQKLFGVGPIGIIISFILLAASVLADRVLGHPEMLKYRSPMEALGALLVCAGLVLYFWTVYVLRNWWAKNQLCTTGPFRWFRHPMYAAWITFLSLGVAVYLNSWILLLWVMSLHPVWHRLVIREEKMMSLRFHEEYRAYAERTGRFIPQLWNLRRP
jgi:protein-S-isoprenylcysteine O-methyltransferase Ste14